MKFSVGDKIIVKETMEEGVVEEIINTEMVLVQLQKVAIPIHVKDIDHPYLQWFLKSGTSKPNKKIHADQLLPEKKIAKEAMLPNGMYLVFYPIYTNHGWDETVEKCNIYLYNETNTSYFFEYKITVHQQTIFELKNEIRPHQEFYIHHINFDHLSNNPKFKCEFYETEKSKVPFEFQLKAKKVFEKLELLKEKNHIFFYEQLFETLLLKKKIKEQFIIEPEKIKMQIGLQSLQNTIQKKAIQVSITDTSVLDLHAENSIPGYKSMTPSEIFYFQMQLFKKFLEYNIQHQNKHITVIHGNGKAILKTEIHKILKNNKYIKSYNNEFSAFYGFGATSIVI